MRFCGFKRGEGDWGQETSSLETLLRVSVSEDEEAPLQMLFRAETKQLFILGILFRSIHTEERVLEETIKWSSYDSLYMIPIDDGSCIVLSATLISY